MMNKSARTEEFDLYELFASGTITKLRGRKETASTFETNESGAVWRRRLKHSDWNHLFRTRAEALEFHAGRLARRREELLAQLRANEKATEATEAELAKEMAK